MDKLLGLLNLLNETTCLPVPDPGGLNVLRLFGFTLAPFSTLGALVQQKVLYGKSPGQQFSPIHYTRSTDNLEGRQPAFVRQN